MTFDEWKDTERGRQFSAAFETEIMSYPEIKQDIARAWSKMLYEQGQKYAQPHWNYCKNGKKPEQDQRVNAIIKPLIKKNPLYVDTVVYRNGNYINERMSLFEDVIAWQPLPEVPSC